MTTAVSLHEPLFGAAEAGSSLASPMEAPREMLQREVAFSIDTPPPVRYCCCLSRTAQQAREVAREAQLKTMGIHDGIRSLCTFTGNYVKTNKYSLLTFPFAALWLQFQQVANVYFLFIGIFYAWERVSPVTGVARFSGALSLGVVLVYAMVLEAVQDWRRYRQDQQINGALCRVLSEGGSGWEDKAWKDVKVGDFVKVSLDEAFPADLLLLISENKDGLAYLSTASLDGETNLKVFEAKTQLAQQGIDRALSLSPELMHQMSSFGEIIEQEEGELARRLRGLCSSPSSAVLRCDLPNAGLYEWSGSVKLQQQTGQQMGGQLEEEVEVEAKQLLLRGATLRRTRWVVGMVTYAGEQTKLQMNDDPGGEKTTHVMDLMQKALVVLLLTQLCLCVACASVKTWWDNEYEARHVYLLQTVAPDWATWPLAFCTFVLLLCYMVPISLIMSIQTVKNLQKIFFDNDYEMYHVQTDTPASARSATLHEELGQVEVVFSDKTGTLTCNEMELLKAHIDGAIYGDGTPSTTLLAPNTAHRRHPAGDDSSAGSSSRSSLTAGALLNESTEVPTAAGLPPLPGPPRAGGRAALSGTIADAPTAAGPAGGGGGDVGLVGGRTKAEITRRIAQGHSSATELLRFWSALALCHQAEVELATAGDEDAARATAMAKARLRQAGRDCAQDARELMLGAMASSSRTEGEEAAAAAAAVAQALRKLSEAVKLEREVLPAADDALLRYSAASPDDKALVEGAAQVGFVFLGRRKGRLLARLLGVVREYEILSVIPFTSERKRMSIILQEVVAEVEASYRLTEILAALLLKEEGGGGGGSGGSGGGGGGTAVREQELIARSALFAEAHRRREAAILEHAQRTSAVIWCKGADSTMRPLLTELQDEVAAAAPATGGGGGGRDKIERAWAAMEKFATVGLRTLVISSRQLQQSPPPQPAGTTAPFDLDEWRRQMLETSRLPKGPPRQAAQAALFAEVECSLRLHGCSAIEDKLQPGVTETLPRLHAAGIAVWVLTGDKVDTAMEIGFSCNLLHAGMNLAVLDEWQPPPPDAGGGGTAGSPLASSSKKKEAGALGIDPQLARHARVELSRLLREFQEGAGGQVLYGPQPVRVALQEDGNAAELQFPEDPAALGLPRDGVYPEDWPLARAARPDQTRPTVRPFVTKRPVAAHPLGLVLHASVLEAALDDEERDEHGYPLLPPSSSSSSVGRGGDGDGSRRAVAATLRIRQAGGSGPVVSAQTTEYRTNRELFMAIGRQCAVVLCCRVSPKQKALVVALGKQSLGAGGGAAVTLAIGDGANDVPMIKEADVGVGISGHEGMQATLASDYAVSQFRYLERLLLVHGRSSYVRISKLVLYFLYKSIVFSLTMSWMSVYNGFSGHSIYDGNIASGFNLLFTFFPVIVMAVLDRDIPSDELLLRHPSLFGTSRHPGHGFSPSNFAAWALNGVWHSIVLFFGSVLIFDAEDPKGRALPFAQLGVAMFGLVHVTVHVKLWLTFSSHTALSSAFWLFSLSTWFWAWPIYTEVRSISFAMNSDLWRSHTMLWRDPRFILALVLLPCVCCVADVAVKYFSRRMTHQFPRCARPPVDVNALKYRLQREARAASQDYITMAPDGGGSGGGSGGGLFGGATAQPVSGAAGADEAAAPLSKQQRRTGADLGQARILHPTHSSALQSTGAVDGRGSTEPPLQARVMTAAGGGGSPRPLSMATSSRRQDGSERKFAKSTSALIIRTSLGVRIFTPIRARREAISSS